MKKHWKYLKYVLRHKWFVFVNCVALGIPLRGIIHDWTKFLPREWFPYAESFYGDREKAKSAFDAAWNHHQKKNDHHPEFWIYYPPKKTEYQLLPMSDKARREMLADWRGAGQALGFPKTWEWYEREKDNILLHPDTRAWVERELRIQKRWHEDKKYMAGMGF